MASIKMIDENDASGKVKEIYDECIEKLEQEVTE